MAENMARLERQFAEEKERDLNKNIQELKKRNEKHMRVSAQQDGPRDNIYHSANQCAKLSTNSFRDMNAIGIT